MKVAIYPLGTVIKLTQDWEFKLHLEYRNDALIRYFLKDKIDLNKFLGRYRWTWNLQKKDLENSSIPVYQDQAPKGDDVYASFKDYNPLPYIKVILPAGTMLSFNRYYIKNGKEAYSSVTFWIKHPKMKKAEKDKLPSGRFWAKLSDVNQIDHEFIA